MTLIMATSGEMRPAKVMSAVQTLEEEAQRSVTHSNARKVACFSYSGGQRRCAQGL